LLVGAAPVGVTDKVDQVAVPRVTRIVLSGTPKDRIETLIEERTIVETETHREGIKVTAVVKALVIAYCSYIC
jgi:hypothetical protein